MSEPTYEELKAKLAEMEKKSGGRRTGALDFRVGEKGGVSVYGLGRFPSLCITSSGSELLDISKDLREFLEENKSAGKLKLKETQVASIAFSIMACLPVISLVKIVSPWITTHAEDREEFHRWRSLYDSCPGSWRTLVLAAGSCGRFARISPRRV
jgi:hypothetical protein